MPTFVQELRTAFEAETMKLSAQKQLITHIVHPLLQRLANARHHSGGIDVDIRDRKIHVPFNRTSHGYYPIDPATGRVGAYVVSWSTDNVVAMH